jgi:hypothetical protein
MRTRLFAAVRRTVRADRAYLDGELNWTAWRTEYRELLRVADDFASQSAGGVRAGVGRLGDDPRRPA